MHTKSSFIAIAISPEEPKIETVKYRANIEKPDHVPRREAARILSEKLPGIWFINPIARVNAACDSPEFQKEIGARQAEWFRLLSLQFGNGWRCKKRLATCTRPTYDEAYEFDGVIVVRECILPFKTWRLLSNYAE